MKKIEELIVNLNDAQQSTRRTRAVYLTAQVEEKHALQQLEHFIFSKEGSSFKELLSFKCTNYIKLSNGNMYEITFNKDLTIKSLEPKEILILPL